jgi:NADH-quinone oxidoreductase subunit E
MSFAPDVETFAFAPEHQAEIERILAKYPPARKQSAVMPLLHLAQQQHGGWLPRAALDHVAEFLEMPRIKVYEVASFYDMYNTEPTGRIQVRVCTTTPCWLCGSEDILRAARNTLGIDVGESSEDGRFFLREFECLGACCNAPMMWIDDDYYEDLDYEKTVIILEALKRGETPKPGPQSGRKGSEPFGERKSLLATMPAEGERTKGRPESGQKPIRKARPVDHQNDPTAPAAKEAKRVSPKVIPEGKVNPDTNGLDESRDAKNKRD